MRENIAVRFTQKVLKEISQELEKFAIAEQISKSNTYIKNQNNYEIFPKKI